MSEKRGLGWTALPPTPLRAQAAAARVRNREFEGQPRSESVTRLGKRARPQSRSWHWPNLGKARECPPSTPRLQCRPFDHSRRQGKRRRILGDATLVLLQLRDQQLDTPSPDQTGL